MRKPIAVFIVLLTMLMFIPNVSELTVQATEVEGADYEVPVVTAFKGQVKILKAGGMQEFTVYKGMKLGKGDTVYTGIDASLEVSYGKKVLLIGSKSMVIINEVWLKYDRDVSDISLIEGSIKNKVGKKLSADSRNQIVTANIVAGVRGTEEVVAYSRNVPNLENTTDNPYSSVLVLEGTVKVAVAPFAIADETTVDENFLVTKDGASKVVDQIAAKPEESTDAKTVTVDQPAIVETSAQNIDLSILEAILNENGGDTEKMSSLLTNVNAILEEKKAEAEQQLAAQTEKETAPQTAIVFDSNLEDVKDSLPPPENNIQLPPLVATSTSEPAAIADINSPATFHVAEDNTTATNDTATDNTTADNTTADNTTANNTTPNNTTTNDATNDTAGNNAAADESTQPPEQPAEPPAEPPKLIGQATLHIVDPGSLIYGDKSIRLSTSGGSGTGAVTYSLVEGNAISITSDGTIKILASGNVKVRASKAADSKYKATKAELSLAVGKRDLAQIAIGATTNAIYMGTPITPTPSVEDKVSNSNLIKSSDYKYSYTNNLNAGTATITITATTNGNYSGSKATTFIIDKAKQSALTVDSIRNLKYGDSPITVSATGGTGSGEISYVIDSGSKYASISGNTLSILGAGTVTLYAEKAADINHKKATSTAITVTIQKAAQDNLSIDPVDSLYVGMAPFKLKTSGGTGSGEVTYAVIDGSAISILGDTVSVNSAGEATIRATKSGGANYTDATAELKIKVELNISSLFLNAVPARAYAPNDQFHLSADFEEIEGEAECTAPITYSLVSGSCIGVAESGVVTVHGVGEAVVKAFIAADKYHEIIESNHITITIQKGEQQEIKIDDLTDLTFGDEPKTLTTTGGTTNGAVTYRVISGPAAIESGDQLKITGAGQVKVSATMEGNANYNDAVAEKTFTVAKCEQSPLTIDDVTITYGDAPKAITTTGGTTNAEVIYRVISGPATIDSDNRLNVTGVGQVKISATMAGNANYNDAVAEKTFTVAKCEQSPLTIGDLTITYGDEPKTLTITGGTTNGTVIYRVISGPATIESGNQLKITGAGQVKVSATMSGDANYNDAVAEKIFTVAKCEQAPLTIGGLTITYGDGPKTLTATGGTTNGTITYRVISGPATIESGDQLKIIGAGQVEVGATMSGDANYNDAVAEKSFTVAKCEQSPLTIGGLTITYGDEPKTLTTTGGTTNGTVTYRVISGPAAIESGNQLKITGAGQVEVGATMSGDANYNDVMAEKTFTVAKSAQATLTIGDLTITYGDASKTLTTIGGTTNGAVTYSVVSGPATIDSGNKLNVTGAGQVKVSATMAGNANYNDAMTEKTFTVAKSEQAPLVIGDLTITYGDAPKTLTAVGGTTNATVTYHVISGPATIESGDQLNVTGAGQVKVSATMAGNANYNDAVAEKTFTVTKCEQAPLTIGSLTFTYGDGPKTLTATGGTTNGTITYRVISGPATIESGDQLKITGAGQVEVSATMLGDENYQDAVAEKTFTVAKCEQSPLTIGDLTITYGDEPKTLTTTGGTTNGTVTYRVISGPATIESDNKLKITGAGQVEVGATMLGDANYKDVMTEKTFTVAKSEQAPLTVGNLTITYGDEPKTLSTTGGTTNGAVTYSVVSGPATIDSGNKLNVTAGGSVVIQAKMAGDNNYLDIVSTNKTITVSKAPLTVSANNSTVVYGNTPTFTAAYTGFVNGDTASALIGTASFTTTYNSNGSSNVGQYPITPVENLSSDKYTISYQNSTLTVTKRPVTITGSVNRSLSTIDCVADLSYTVAGEVSGYPANVTITSNNDAVTYNSSLLTYAPAKGSGTGAKTITIEVNSSGNYVGDNVDIPFVIADGVTVAVPVNASNIYNLQEQNYTNMKFELTENIDNLGTWKPITSMNNCEFNGKGHVIKNMNLTTGANFANAGFIGKTTGTTTIKFLGIEKASAINDNNTATSTINIGFIVGYMNDYGTVENCYVGDLDSIINQKLPDNAVDVCIGLLVGYSRGTITKCYATGQIYTTNGKRVLIAGMQGKSENSTSFVNNCIAIEFYFNEENPTEKNVAAIGCIGASTIVSNNYEFGGSAARGETAPGVQYEDGSPYVLGGQYSHYGTRLPLTTNLTAAWWTDTLNFNAEDWDFTDPMAPKLKAK